MDKGDRHAAFADAARYAFDRTVTHVARTEYAGKAGLQGKRLAFERPTGQVSSRANITIGVTLQRGWEPCRVRRCADHQEERIGVTRSRSVTAIGVASGGYDLLQMLFTLHRG